VKIRTGGAELFCVDRQKDRQPKGQTDGYDEANNKLSQFC